MRPRWWIIAGGIVALLLILVVVAAFFAEEPLRHYAESLANESLPDYHITIGALALHPLTLAVDIREVVVHQQANPEPPLAVIPEVRADARLLPLLSGQVAADLHVDKPVVAATGPQVDSFLAKEAEQEAAAWQDRVRDAIPFRLSLFLHDGEATYEGPPAVGPVHLGGLSLIAENLTNRPPNDEPYPARIQVNVTLLEKARLSVQGRANPLAKPSPAVQADVQLEGLQVAEALKAVGRTDAPLKEGILDATVHVTYGSSEDQAITIEQIVLREPKIEYVPTAEVAAASAESQEEVASAALAWQDKVFQLFPVTIRQATIQNGEITYRPDPRAEPIRIQRLDITTSNIHNRPSEPGQYPSETRVAAQLGEESRITVDGRADFLAKPMPRVDANLDVRRLHLGSLLPAAKQINVHTSEGVLDLSGRVQYANEKATVAIDRFLLEGARIDYVHAAITKGKEQARLKEGAKQARTAGRDPSIQVRVGHGKILNSEMGFVNKAASPDYRVFMADMNAEMDNLSTRPEEGTGAVKVTGKFMGSGPTVMSGNFRPEKPTPDFDLRVKIIKTKMASFNNVLRAHGGLDTKGGVFAFFSEISVRNNHVDGYVKPLLRDVDVYDPKQDQDKKMTKRLYEAVVGGVLGLLENAPRDEVATKGDISGKVENPQASTWQIVGNLVQNAFFNAILPGFEQGPVG